MIEKIKKENKNKVENYICAILRFATQTFNGGYKRKMNTDYERYVIMRNLEQKMIGY